MNLRELYHLCQIKDWDKLHEFMGASISASGMSWKILASSIFSAHHTDENVKAVLGLATWDELIRNKLIAKYQTTPLKFFTDAAIYSSVDLTDFLVAYEMARNKIDQPGRPGLDDVKAAKAIYQFVASHKEDFQADLQALQHDPDGIELLELLKKDFEFLFQEQNQNTNNKI